MASQNLRIEKYPTVLYNANLNPLGIPESVKTAITENIGSITKYPDIYYNNLKNAVADYTGMTLDRIVMGNGSAVHLSFKTEEGSPSFAGTYGIRRYSCIL